MNKLYKIIFTDNSQYEGGNITDTKWLNIPKNKKIMYLFYFFPSLDCLFLSNYEKYYQYIEVTKDLNGENKGKINVEAISVLGKRGNIINVYKINIKTSNIELSQFDENDDEIIKLNPEGWR